MISKKKYMGLFLAIISIIISVLFLATFNIGIRYYVDNEARETINKYIRLYMLHDDYTKMYGKNGYYFISGMYEISDSMFDISEIEIDENYSYDYITPLEKNLVNYYTKNKDDIEDFEIYKVNLNGKKIYFTSISQKNISKEYSETFLFYIDTSSVFYMSDLLCKVFILIIIIIVLVSSLLGFEVGKKLEKSEEKLRRFFSNASHELKTPLMSIQGYAEGVYTGVMTDTKGASKIILEQSERMESLVEELLLLSKIESGYLKLEENEIDLLYILDSIINANKPLTTNIDIEINFPNEEIIIIGDEKQLYKAIDSIYSNAIKFTKDKIRVSIFKNNKNINIIISDNGQGIAKEDMNYIFDRFYYGKNGSTGIGLSLSQEIINLHKGKIVAKNNNGAEFTISIPINI